MNICHGFIHVKAFFFCCQDDRGSRGAAQSEVRNSPALCSTVSSVLLLSFHLDYFEVCKITLRKEKKKKRTCTIIFFIYSDALHSLGNITVYLLQTLNGHGYRCLGNEKCNRHFCFQLFVFDYFLFDKLENKFLLYMIISLHIYIYTNIYIKCHCIKDFVFNIYYCEHGIYSLLHALFSFWDKG